MTEPTDVSHAFWGFVEYVLANEISDDIHSMASYKILQQCSEHPMCIRMSAVLMVEPTEGVNDFVHFEDINALFYGIRRILQRHRKATLALRVDACIRKMVDHVELMEMAQELDAMTL